MESGVATRHFVCRVEELEPGSAKRLDVDPPIAVFNIAGTYYATSDTCTHDESSLADGYLEGDEVECAWHFARFCVRTGDALTPPAFEPLRTFTTEVEDGNLYVKISDGVRRHT